MMTVLTLKRTETIDKGTFGELYINGQRECYTLENTAKMIPAGIYTIVKIPKGYRLQSVPGRSNINIEIGNYPFESLGCIFVGTSKDLNGVYGSKVALWRLVRHVKLPATINIKAEAPLL